MKFNNTANYTILVVEHITTMTGILVYSLKSLGITKIFKAKDSHDAIEILRSNKVDLILAEEELPKFSGLELLKYVRSEELLADIPFIMLSAEIGHKRITQAIKYGVSEYIIKPFNIKILYERLQKAISTPVRKINKHSKRQVIVNDEGAANEKSTILIVDDVVDNIVLMNEALKDNYNILVANSGEKALKICRSHKQPDLVLLDILMPKIDGFEVCQQLKESPETSHIEVIFVTSAEQVNNIVKGFELGAVDYITKPIFPAVLRARVSTHTRLISQRKMLTHQVDSLIESSQVRDEFDRVINKDVKNTLQEIERFTNNIKIDYSNKLRVKANNLAINNSCTLLGNFFDQMTIMLAIEDGKYQLNISQVSLSTLYFEELKSLIHICNEKQLEIDMGGVANQSLLIDEKLVALGFSNLLLNAIEAAPRGSLVKVTGSTLGSHFITKIVNVGHLDEKICSTIFDKYSTSGKTNHLGMGAYAAKVMIEMHGGEVDFSTNILNHTEFFFSLPMDKPLLS